MTKKKSPKTVQNFWLDATIDGRKTPISSGTSSAKGGLKVKISQRANGQVAEAFTLDAKANDDTLLLTLTIPGKDVITFHTPR